MSLYTIQKLLNLKQCPENMTHRLTLPFICTDINECAEANGGCNHICVDDKVGYHCECYQGAKLGSDNLNCEDKDECIDLLPCSQICTNLPRTYHCSCASGFKLAADKMTCKPSLGLSLHFYSFSYPLFVLL